MDTALGTAGLALAATLMALPLTAHADPAAELALGADVAFDELATQQNRAAIDKLEATPSTDDPAALINLGIAHAREGNHDMARAMFVRAAQADTRYQLETASGEWADSRWLARRALAMLDRGDFGNTGQLAAR